MTLSIDVLAYSAAIISRSASNNGGGWSLGNFISNLTAWFLPLLLMIVIIVSFLFFIRQEWMKMIGFIGVSAVVGVLIIAPGAILNTAENTASEIKEAIAEETSSEPVEAPEEEPVEQAPTPPAEPAEPLDWQPLIFVLAGTIALAAISTVIYIIRKGVLARREARAAAEERERTLTAEWDTVRQRYQELTSTISSYELDIELAIRYPVMNDASEPSTAHMLKVLDKTERLRSAISDTGIGGSQSLLNDFSERVTELSAAVEQAEAQARRVALSKLSETDRKDFEQAQRLLTHVLDEANPDQVRANYTERLKVIIDRINERNNKNIVPRSTLAEIEKIEFLALPVA